MGTLFLFSTVPILFKALFHRVHVRGSHPLVRLLYCPSYGGFLSFFHAFLEGTPILFQELPNTCLAFFMGTVCLFNALCEVGSYPSGFMGSCKEFLSSCKVSLRPLLRWVPILFLPVFFGASYSLVRLL